MQKRPSDKTIRTTKIVFGLIFSSTLYYNLISQWDAIDSSILFMDIAESNLEYIKYWLISIWIIPVFMWISNLCLLKKKHMRILQIVFAVILFYISSIIVESASLDVDSLIWFMALLPLVWWITWKCITSNCMKYKEKITKIRV